MSEVLKITVDDKGVVKVFENGIETTHLKKIVFIAEVGKFPKLETEKVFT